ncbi:GNAT family N-acetyltransferase [Halobacillus salinarum]|uniref:GNAT family N-acetyltransferase n=1 Tax=Halobacillus salinarum TaxID=2932257 RepID=A0ABY4EJ27_9BACI|nr:GNAT family N-acetyltransferase [Halobacillus salinarum]UOQ43970.1 GNAT family N-acetyltransferase [Halobacillus salinarum]
MRNTPVLPQWKSNRLILRALWPSDVLDIFHLRMDERLFQYLDRSPYETVEQASEFIKNINDGVHYGHWFMWALEHRGAGKVIGTVCLWNFNPNEQAAELGYELHPDFQGEGLMQETVRTVLHYGFSTLGLAVVFAYTNANHLKSIRLLERNHFRRKRFIEEMNKKGTTSLMSLYQLQKEDFEPFN